MSNYIATVQHHSLARAPEIAVSGSLTKAKRAATRAFGMGFLDHTIAIYESEPGRAPELVASRKVGEKVWH